ncbi:thyrotropin-releasing hormone receptor [Eurosta solidaginis]|uniref:thyrotropin-releasing hormone receptor n=1 Tax=Eurosta solidaginis TaxID=178769 RepID=UPI003530EC30
METPVPRIEWMDAVTLNYFGVTTEQSLYNEYHQRVQPTPTATTSSPTVSIFDAFMLPNNTHSNGTTNLTNIINIGTIPTINNSSIFSITFDDNDEMLAVFEKVGILLNYYYVPFLVLTGSLGNILSVFVFFKTNLRKLSSSFYLAALAVSDTCFLLGLFMQWLNFVDIDIYNRDFFCQFFTFFSNLASFCSAWFVVAFTVERFIAVGYPLRRQTMCTVRRAKIVLFALTTVGCIHCTPYWLSSASLYSPKLETVLCDMNPEFKVLMTYWNYWDTVTVFTVPFAIIFVLNTITGCRVWKFATVRRSLTVQKRRTPHIPRDTRILSACNSSSLRRQRSTTPSYSTTHSNEQQPEVKVLRRKSERRISNSSQLKVTKMLLIVSTVFVCLNLPSCVMRIKTYLETQTSTNAKTTVILQYIFQLLFFTNFGINFVLYCVSGQNFRKAVISMFRRVSSSTQREGITQVTVSEYCRNSGRASASTRRRVVAQQYWNEIHELNSLK